MKLYYTSHHPQAREFREISEQLTISHALNENPEMFLGFNKDTEFQSTVNRTLNVKSIIDVQ